MAVTDRFQKAVEQLTSDEVDIRLSGIYMLERLAKDSPADHSTAFSVLSAFVRTHTDHHECKPPRYGEKAPVDIQAIITVIGRRDISHETADEQIDLSETCLAGLNLESANLADANLNQANLTDINATGANLTGAKLRLAALPNSYLSEANLTGADFTGADLSSAQLGTVGPSTAQMNGISTSGPAILDHTNFSGADLTGTNLQDVNLSTATLAPDEHTAWEVSIFPAVLDYAYYNDRTQWPESFTPPASAVDFGIK
ncbi:pentapeptide repeat-containing protein [Nocardia carnea]|uniref:pentapeptide repeat-containing protein n=1 Tax=Nocardia carnea TaxID=37328 RepID=UPI00030589EB|nr:pentapeptide repeat-containing protein [Nocardia carnea]